MIELPQGPEHKSLASCQYIWQQLAGQKYEGIAFVNVGGGQITDLGGYAAAVYKRGCPFIHVPQHYSVQWMLPSEGKQV